MRRNIQKAVGTHFGKATWLTSTMKPPKATYSNIDNLIGNKLNGYTFD